MPKKYSYPKGQSPFEIRQAAEKEYRAARRALARAQRIEGTYDEKEFRKSKRNLLGVDPEETKMQAEMEMKRRESTLIRTVETNKGQRKGEGAHRAASAIFDMTDKSSRKALRDAIGEGEESGDNLLSAEDAFLSEDMEEFYEDSNEGNEFDPEEDEDWALIY